MGDTEAQIPRRYQEEVFIKAQTGNIVAALQTGSGKTLISLLLIKWTAAKPESKGKFIIFLAPKVALVEQQAKFISQNTPLHSHREDAWSKRFREVDVFVMTAQTCLNLLSHSIWSFERVSLLIFDECHHARKNHPYNSIMREYFQKSSRPKIFGMTASPIWNPKDPEKSLAELERNLDAKVIGVHENVEELHTCAPKAVEVLRYYSPPPQEYDYPEPSLWKCLRVFPVSLWDTLEIPWLGIEMRYYATLGNLGPYCASLFLFSEMNQHIHRILKEAESLDGLDMAMDIDFPFPMQAKEPPPEIFEVADILIGFRDFFAAAPFPIHLHWCSPKIKSLVGLLLEHYSPGFQGIVFVEQRQVAACLAQCLPRISELGGTIKCSYLVGHGLSKESIAICKATDPGRDAIQEFRDGTINLQGLDFPACDFVIRFDALQHMVGYVQSRGRARNKASTFIVMIQERDDAQIERSFGGDDDDDDGVDDISPVDLAERERYVVESTGAVLSYENSIQLLNHLCSLIPRDSFTPPHMPRYSGDFQATVHLPSSIPLPAEDITFTEEAKRAVAFLAVKHLHVLDVFNDYLLPSSGKESEDKATRPNFDANKIPTIVNASVADPWVIGLNLWIHPVLIDGRCIAGLITGTNLPPVSIKYHGFHVSTSDPQLLAFSKIEEYGQRRSLEEYTKLGIWYTNTTRPFKNTGVFLVPITEDSQPDFDTMHTLLSNPRGNYDWTGIGDEAAGKLLLMNDNEIGRTRLLRRICHDLNPMSAPTIGSREDGYKTYYDFFIQKWSSKKRGKRLPHVPLDGPLVECLLLPQSTSSVYSLGPSSDNQAESTVLQGDIAPQGCCRWVAMTLDIRRAFEILPSLCHRLTDIYRARRIRSALALPPINDDLLIEALTLPSTGAGYSNQRLETLGDAVLEICTTVHLMNKYPYRHEGQLSTLRSSDILLERFLTSEMQSGTKWRYIQSEAPLNECRDEPHPPRFVNRQYPRRSLQDCMEAILGASFLSGGISMALRAGESLGMAFGGDEPWSTRYRQPLRSASSALFKKLQDSIGYEFNNGLLLVEAVTHPSFTTTPGEKTYQRLEYLYDKFPLATSEQLSMPRSKAVCSAALAYIAVRHLDLHKMMLVNNIELESAVSRYAPLLEGMSAEEIVHRGWRYSPPKALSDVFESVVGAVFVDSGYDYDRVEAVVELVMTDVLEALSPSMRKNPVSELTEWVSQSGCHMLTIKEIEVEKNGTQRNGIVILVHKTTVCGPIISQNPSVARFVASERAMSILKNQESSKRLSELCTCGTTANKPTISFSAPDFLNHENTTNPGVAEDTPHVPDDDDDGEAWEREEVVSLLTTFT
ncbi:hypothetical protein BD779DRAFT_1502798 [Infundibulicybe gibba]|nr:hypothetical protein BD779DRAFT_1502798 [Infundibulicybe gibba]